MGIHDKESTMKKIDVSTLSDLIVKIDLNMIADVVIDGIGAEKIAAYEQYLACRATAKDVHKVAQQYTQDADFLARLVEDNFKLLMTNEKLKAVLAVPYALGQEQELVYDRARLAIAMEIVFQDQATFGKYVDEAKGENMVAYLYKVAAEARKECVALYNEGDQILKDNGLDAIIEKRNALREAKVK
jgi:hypothetical protein